MPKSPTKSLRIPSYCLHKPTGQGYVTLNGRMIYFTAATTQTTKWLLHSVALLRDGI